MYNIMGKVVVAFAMVWAIWSCNAFADQSVWIGPDGGSWQNANNWSPKQVPDNNMIPGVSYSVTIATTQRTRINLQQGVEINSLVCSGDVDFEHSQPTPIVITGTGLVNNGRLEFSGVGPHDVKGSFVNSSGAELQPSNLLNIDGDLTNEGSIFLLGSSEYTGLDVGEGGVITNNGKIVILHSHVVANGFINGSSGAIEGSGWIGVGETIQNQGIISASFGELSILFAGGGLSNTGTIRNSAGASVLVTHLFFEGEISNEGMVEVNAGGGVTFDTTVRNKSAGTLKLLDGVLAAPSIIQTKDAGFSGFGTITGNIVIEQDGKIQLTGPANVIGTVDIGANATLEISDGQTLITGHTTNNGTIHLKSGGIGRFQGGLTDNGDIIHESGSYYTQEELEHAVGEVIRKYDPSLDGKVGLEEAIHALRIVSGIVTQ